MGLLKLKGYIVIFRRFRNIILMKEVHCILLIYSYINNLKECSSKSLFMLSLIDENPLYAIELYSEGFPLYTDIYSINSLYGETCHSQFL